MTQINDFGNAETVTRPDKRNEMIWIDMKRFNDHTNYRDKKKLEPHNIRGENRISFFFWNFGWFAGQGKIEFMLHISIAF